MKGLLNYGIMTCPVTSGSGEYFRVKVDRPSQKTTVSFQNFENEAGLTPFRYHQIDRKKLLHFDTSFIKIGQKMAEIFPFGYMTLAYSYNMAGE